MLNRRTRSLAVLACTAVIVGMIGMVATPAPAAGRTLRIGGYTFFNDETGCPTGGVGVGTFAGFTRAQCARVEFIVDGGGTTLANGQAPALTPAPGFQVTFKDETGATVGTTTAALDAGDTYFFEADFATFTNPQPGTISFTLTSTTDDILVGQPAFQMTFNALGTRTLLANPYYAVAAGGLPAADLRVHGVTWEKFNKASIVASDPTDSAPNPDLKPADVTITLTRKDGSTIQKTDTADTTGNFEATFTAAEVGDVSATAATNYETPIKISTLGTYTDPATGAWRTASVDTEATAHAVYRSTPTGPQVRASFVSERGWVAPGEQYVHAVEYRSAVPATGVVITDVLPADSVFISSIPAPTSRSGNTLTWNIGTLASSEINDLTSPRPKYPNKILVTARAKTGAENPRVMFQDLSDSATLTYTGGSVSSTSHGPQVRSGEGNRLGDRPFPIVLVDYSDFKHSPAANGWSFHYRINEPANPASMYTHYQNMSYGQLFPAGEVTSFSAPANATYSAGGPYKWSNPYLKGTTCTGTTQVPPQPAEGTTPAPLTTTFTPIGPRVTDGWYQLPGQRSYYGQDGKGTAIAPVGDLDGGCGPTSKIAYDAASAADPDLDYNDYDSDRNCLVDFFEVAFQGRGGNGDSQTHGYDNVWPHSGNMVDSYSDANGQLGYVSNDQCRDRLERPLWWTDEFRTTQTTVNKGDALRVYSRVGPYNVNPENGTTSVFAHEYGHSLGLPDYYSGDRTTIDYWDLMATDGFQYMSAHTRAELGWVVPKRARTGTFSLKESKADTNRIDAIGTDGVPYSVTGDKVGNGDAYYVELPHRVLFNTVPDGKWAYWSTAGNGYGCPGRYLELRLNTTLQAPAGSTLKMTFKSWYEVEWDFDYGFVMVSTDGGKTFTALESENGTTTPKQFNPQNNVCQSTYGNGITGTSAQKDFPENIVDRTDGVLAEPAFIDDSFDVSACAGKPCIIRFAYSTDTGVANRGWVIDKLRIAEPSAASGVYFEDSFETERLGSYVNNKWIRFKAGPSPFDHGYYIELRDRISNDFDSAGQGERHPIDWIPGVSVWYTDRAHGDGNNGTDDPPAQITIDARKQASQQNPRLNDAAFWNLPGIDAFQDRDWTDNYLDADGNPLRLRFSCFSMRVNSISGGASSLTFGVSPTRCVRVLGIAQGKPKPPRVKPLPATGLGANDWLTLGVSLMAAALVFRRTLIAVGPDWLRPR